MMIALPNFDWRISLRYFWRTQAKTVSRQLTDEKSLLRIFRGEFRRRDSLMPTFGFFVIRQQSRPDQMFSLECRRGLRSATRRALSCRFTNENERFVWRRRVLKCAYRATRRRLENRFRQIYERETPTPLRKWRKNREMRDAVADQFCQAFEQTRTRISRLLFPNTRWSFREDLPYSV